MLFLVLNESTKHQGSGGTVISYLLASYGSSFCPSVYHKSSRIFQAFIGVERREVSSFLFMIKNTVMNSNWWSSSAEIIIFIVPGWKSIRKRYY